MQERGQGTPAHMPVVMDDEWRHTMGNLDQAMAESGRPRNETGADEAGAMDPGGVDLQEGDAGATAEEQIEGSGKQPAEQGSDQPTRVMPTNA